MKRNAAKVMSAILATAMMTSLVSVSPVVFADSKISQALATSKDELVESFVERLYTIALKRSSEKDGLEYWSNVLKNHEQNGGEVAYGFFFSDELIRSNISDVEFINRLYKTFMNREGDTAGFDYWKSQMESGVSRQDIFWGFINSIEWAEICAQSGIISGGSAIAKSEVGNFVERIYTIALNRDSELGGKTYWTNIIVGGAQTGSEVAYGFFFSKELTDADVNNGEFVKRLYGVFFDRKPDKAGYDYWVGILNSGVPREEVFNGFANSAEWANICGIYGIAQGVSNYIGNTTGPYTSIDSLTKDRDGIYNLTMFSAMPGTEINYGNDIQEIIAEKTGVRVKETWLVGQTAQEAVGSIIASGNLPDFIDGGDGMAQLYDAGVLVAWDDYIEKYPNLKELYSPEEWDMFRMDDGHIYWANVFCNSYGEEKAKGHNDEAFWIQARVLEWAGYPKIETLDEYFDVLAKYAEANPTMPDGTPVIPYTALCDDWRYFCIENAPLFLDGYPNDGSVIVNVDDPKNPKIVDYNTTETAHMYFKKLNEVFNAGLMDVDFAIQTYDEYIAKLSTGRVLGMCDQYWDFAYLIDGPYAQQGLDKLGCDYVPLGLVAEKGMKQQWHSYGDTLINSSGCAVTTSCKDPDVAFKFLNDILDQEIHDLRYWGVKGVDYLVDENGEYYRTQEMRDNWKDETFKANHVCTYSYMPQWLGTSRDGVNAMQPQEQASEFFAGLADPLVACFNAYGANGYADMVGSDKNARPAKWYPMYSFSNLMTTETAGGVAWMRIGIIKHELLPRVVMAKDFEAEWANYMEEYNACNPQAFLDEMQEELDRRVQLF